MMYTFESKKTKSNTGLYSLYINHYHEQLWLGVQHYNNGVRGLKTKQNVSRSYNNGVRGYKVYQSQHM